MLKGTLAVRGRVCCFWETILTLRSLRVSEVRQKGVLSTGRSGPGYREQGVGEWAACWTIDQRMPFFGGHKSWEGLSAGSAMVDPSSETCRKERCLHKSRILSRLVSGHKSPANHLGGGNGTRGSEPFTDKQGGHPSLIEPICSRLDLPETWFLIAGQQAQLSLSPTLESA